jgi:F0F1-type ATP synthase assembly protein I
MKKAAAHTTTNNADDDAFGITTIALDFLDTTWRIAVPVVLFAGIGIFVDIKVHTKPWLTLLGVIIGFVFAGLLLKQQLSAVSNRNKTPDTAKKDKQL